MLLRHLMLLVLVLFGGASALSFQEAHAQAAGVCVKNDEYCPAIEAQVDAPFEIAGDVLKTKVLPSVEDVQSRLGVEAELIRGHRGHDVLMGGAGNDLIDGGLDDDRVSGGAGNDILQASAGDDMLDGGDGYDIVELKGSYGEYRLTRTSEGVWVSDSVSGRDGSDLLTNVEALSFKDIQRRPSLTTCNRDREFDRVNCVCCKNTKNAQNLRNGSARGNFDVDCVA